MARLKEFYNKEVVSNLKKEYGYKNIHQVPKMMKIVINMGLGEAVQDVKIIDKAVAEMTLISGQKPVVTRARKSIASFKYLSPLYKGNPMLIRGIYSPHEGRFLHNLPAEYLKAVLFSLK